LLVKLDKVRFFPNRNWNVVGQFLTGATIDISTDGSTFTTAKTVDDRSHVGWNSIMFDSDQAPVRAIKFSHTSGSSCNLIEFEVWGSVYSNAATPTDLSSFTTDVIFDDMVEATPTVWSNKITFEKDATPVVDTVKNNRDGDKPNGDVYGGYDITLAGTFPTGTNFEITIDGIACPVSGTPTTTEIVCTVGSRPQLPDDIYFTVVVDNKKAIINQ